MGIKRIRNAIVKGLYKHLGMIPIPLEDLQKKEEYPYLTYNFINPYTQFRGQGNEYRELVPSTDERFEFDVEETLKLEPQATISINAYSREKLEAQETAKRAMDWFLYEGYQYLADNNIVVVNVEASGDRTVQIIDFYEHRVGFDVIIRFADELKRRYETIETVKVETEIKEVLR